MPEEVATTIEAPAAPEPSYNSVLEASFNQHAADLGMETAVDPNAPISEPAPAKAPVPAVTETTVKAPESEFPEELVTGEKPVEAPVKDELDEIQPSPKFGEAARANFDKLKAIAREAKANAAKLQVELEAAKTATTKPVDDTELKSARQKLAEMEEVVARLNYEATPAYQKLVTSYQNTIKDAKSYLEGTEINPNIIDLAASLTGKARIGALKDAGLDPETVGAISAHLSTADNLRREQSEALTQAKERTAQWERQTKAEQEAEEAARAQDEKRAFDDAMAEAEGKYDVLKTFQGQEKWNTQIADVKKQSEEFFLQPKPAKEQASVVVKGVAFDLLHRLFLANREALKAAKAEVFKLKAAQPGGGTGTNGQKTPVVATTAEDLMAERARMFDEGVGR